MAELNGPVRDILDSVAAESIGALHGSAVGRVLQPARYGGFALGTEEFVSVVLGCAALDGSLGWLASVFNVAAHEVADLPEHVADEVWNSDPRALITTSHRAADGCLHDRRLTGRWTSVIGAEQADWLLLTAETYRVLVPRGAARIAPVTSQTGLNAAGICDVTVTDLQVDDRHIFTCHRDAVSVVAGAGAAAAVVGSADGVWRQHVEQVRARLAASYGGDEMTNQAATQVARAASDIDAAKIQVTTSLHMLGDAALWAHRQAVARACGAADRLLGSSRHALDASDPATRMWKDVYAGSRLAAAV